MSTQVYQVLKELMHPDTDMERFYSISTNGVVRTVVNVAIAICHLPLSVAKLHAIQFKKVPLIH